MLSTLSLRFQVPNCDFSRMKTMAMWLTEAKNRVCLHLPRLPTGCNRPSRLSTRWDGAWTKATLVIPLPPNEDPKHCLSLLTRPLEFLRQVCPRFPKRLLLTKSNSVGQSILHEVKSVFDPWTSAIYYYQHHSKVNRAMAITAISAERSKLIYGNIISISQGNKVQRNSIRET